MNNPGTKKLRLANWPEWMKRNLSRLLHEPEPFRPPSQLSSPKWLAVEISAAVLVALFLAVSAFHFHPMPDNINMNPELDFYHHRAEVIASGEIPADRYRPLLYPFLGALVSPFFGGDCYRGCQLVSLLSGFLFLYFLYKIAKRYFGPRPALLSILLTATNSHVWLASSRAASGMLFQVLSMLLLYLTLRLQENPPRPFRFLIELGVVWGLAYSSRYTALFYLPLLLLMLYFWRDRFRLKDYLLFIAFVLIAILPQLLINTYNFGSPFYSENWKNLAVKYLKIKSANLDSVVTGYVSSLLRILNPATI